MKFSRLFIPTTKETPKDASLASHQYLIRAGFISMEGAGLYNFMPLGKIVLDKIKTIIKDELDKAGCNEVSLSIVTPQSLWDESGRASKMGLEMLRFKDRKGSDFVLSPTNEEAMVSLVKNRIKSYKNLPINLYQINTKFRDEARPRFGLLRGREFLMKDGYSFASNDTDMRAEFALMEQTYRKIFTRLGLEFRVVDADSGAIGGSGSKEFMVIANSGEDTITLCDKCNYSANIEAATRESKKPYGEIPEGDFNKFKTPNIKTIDELSDYFKVSAFYTLKAVIKKAIYDDNTEIVVFFIRGDDELQDVKAANAVKANEIIDATEDEIIDAGLVAGFVGPIDLKVKYIVDNEVRGQNNIICGANEIDYHFIGVDLSQMILNSADLISVKEGDICSCGGTISYTKGIEAGHIFALGDKYSKALNATFLDENGKAKPFIMGTYGIGVSRLVSAVIEQHHDEKGCKWTKETAPFDVDILVSNIKDDEQLKVGEKLYQKLIDSDISVIFDDRKERYGAKINDFELIGFRYAIVIGKNLKDNQVELIDRETLSKTLITTDKIFDKIVEVLS